MGVAVNRCAVARVETPIALHFSIVAVTATIAENYGRHSSHGGISIFILCVNCQTYSLLIFSVSALLEVILGLCSRVNEHKLWPLEFPPTDPMPTSILSSQHWWILTSLPLSNFMNVPGLCCFMSNSLHIIKLGLCCLGVSHCSAIRYS